MLNVLNSYYAINLLYIFTSVNKAKIMKCDINIENIEIKVPVAGYGKPLVLLYDEPIYIADSYPDAVKYVEKNLL
jgi:hypothetical protein